MDYCKTLIRALRRLQKVITKPTVVINTSTMHKITLNLWSVDVLTNKSFNILAGTIIPHHFYDGSSVCSVPGAYDPYLLSAYMCHKRFIYLASCRIIERSSVIQIFSKL